MSDEQRHDEEGDPRFDAIGQKSATSSDVSRRSQVGAREADETGEDEQGDDDPVYRRSLEMVGECRTDEGENHDAGQREGESFDAEREVA